MKKTIIVILYLTFATQLTAQNSELQLQFRYGYPTDNLKDNKTIVTSNIYHTTFLHYIPVHDLSAVFTYKYKIWKRYNVYISYGAELAQSKDYLPIFDRINNRHVANVDLINNRYTYHYGFSKQFSLIEDKVILDLGFDFVKRHYFSEERKINGFGDCWDDTLVKYDYSINIQSGRYYLNSGYHPSNFLTNAHIDWNATLKFNVLKKMFLNVGLSYSRNYYYYFNEKFNIYYYEAGNPYPVAIVQQQGYQGDSKEIVRNNYFYINMGLSYKFDLKKKSQPIN